MRSHIASGKARYALRTNLFSHTPPPLSEADKICREDCAWSVAAKAYTEAMAAVDTADAEHAKTKADLAALAHHPKNTGAVDYKQVLALKGVDLVTVPMKFDGEIPNINGLTKLEISKYSVIYAVTSGNMQKSLLPIR